MNITRSPKTGMYIVHAPWGSFAFMSLREAKEFVELYKNAC